MTPEIATNFADLYGCDESEIQVDGVLNPDLYAAASIKVLWILKETWVHDSWKLMGADDAYKTVGLGTYEGWTRYLIEYKGHTLVASINDLSMSCGLKLLKDDRLAKEIYQANYPGQDKMFQKVEVDSPVYGHMESGIPHAYDDVVERMETAVDFLEDLMIQDDKMKRYVLDRFSAFTD